MNFRDGDSLSNVKSNMGVRKNKFLKYTGEISYVIRLARRFARDQGIVIIFENVNKKY